LKPAPFLRPFAFALFVASTGAMGQANYASTGSGDWTDDRTWSRLSGIDLDGIPDANDNVTILNRHVVKVNSGVDSECNELTLQGTGEISLSQSNRTLTVHGMMIMNGNSSVTGGPGNNTLVLLNNFAILRAQVGTIADVNVLQVPPFRFEIVGELISSSSAGTKSVGNVTINHGGSSTGKWTFEADETWNVNNFNILGAPDGESIVTGSRTGTIVVDGILVVELSDPGHKAKFGDINLTVNGETQVQGHLLFTIDDASKKIFNNTITVYNTGTWENDAGADPVVNCSIVNSGNWLSSTGGAAVYKVDVDGSYLYSGTTPIHMDQLVVTAGTVTNQTKLVLEGDPDQGLQVSAVNAASFVNGAGGYLTLPCTGNAVELTSGTIDFSMPSNTVEYSLNGAQNIYATIYDKLICSNGGEKSQSGPVTINKELHLSGNAVHVAGNETLNGTGNLVMANGSELRLAKTGVNLPEMTGISNALASGTTITLNGAGPQILKSSATFPYQDIRVSGSVGSAIDLSSVSTILGNVKLTASGAITSVSPGGLTVVGSYNSNSAGTTNISGGTGNLTVGDIVFGGTGTFDYSGKTITINSNGAWTNNGIANLASNVSSMVVFNGVAGQSIGGTTSTTFNNLTINNTNGVSLGAGTTTVLGTLNLVAGSLSTGSRIIVAPTITRTSGFVQGNLQKAVNAGSNIMVTYDVGTGTTYTPVTLTFASVSVPGSFIVSSEPGDHPNILSANIEPTFSVNRYYALSRLGGLAFTTLSATLNFAISDVDAGFSPATDAAVKGYNGTNWFNTVVSSRNVTSTTFTGLSYSFFPADASRDFQIGRRIIVSGFFNRLTGTRDWHSPATWINNRDGNITLTNGSAQVTGSGTLFNIQLVAGDQLVLQSAPTATPVTVLSIEGNNSLTLTAPYSGTSGTGGFGRLRVPNSTADSVVIGNPRFTGGADQATTIQLSANATAHTLVINPVPTTGRNTAQVLTHIGASQLTVGSVIVNQPSNPTGTITDAWNINAGSAVVSGNVTIGSGNSSANRRASIVLTSGSPTPFLTIGGNLIYNTQGINNEVTAVLNVGSGRINLAGSLNYGENRGTLSMGTSGVFNFNGTTAAQALNLPDNSAGSFVFTNIECNNVSPNGVQVTENITSTNLKGNLRVLSGKLQMVANSPNITGTGSNILQLANGATLEMLGTGTQKFPASFVYELGNSSTVIYSQTANVNLPASPETYGNLMFAGAHDYALDDATITVNGDLTIGTGTSSTTLDGTGTNSLTVMGNALIAESATLDAARIQSIFLNGNWTNNGTFTPGEGTSFVSFGGEGTVQPQIIGGTTANTFYRVIFFTNDATDVVRMSSDVVVSNQLVLLRGGLDLNGNLLSVTSPANTAIFRLGGGYIKSETTASPYSRLRRTINEASGTFVYPFGKSSANGDYIPFTARITNAGGEVGTFEVATYATATDNKPYPEGVTDVNIGDDASGAEVADRFWILTRAGFTTTPVANLTFTCTTAEASGILGNLRAQRWTPGNIWEDVIAGQTNPTTNSVTVPGVTALSPWTLSGHLTPLPIELLKFEVQPVNGVVELTWETVTERNNSYFEIERSRDGEEFTSIGKIAGAGNSQLKRNYNFTDTYPMGGLAYYRLVQVDFDGRVKYSNVLRVEVVLAFTIMLSPNPFTGNDLNISWRDGEPGSVISVRLWSQSGAKVFSGDIVLDEEMKATISMDNKLNPGVYILEAVTTAGVQRLKVVLM
jgi:hypothetical protein